jgi:hypothetical protein
VYRINRTRIKTKEEKLAERMTTLMSDFTLDLEKVGYYLAKTMPYVIFCRSLEVLESAQFQKPIIDEIRGDTYNDQFYK